MPKTMQVFDKNFKRTGTLIDAYSIERRRRLNSDYELSFLVPMTSEDYLDKIQMKGHVQDERGQFYVINSRKRDRSKKTLTALITATHVMFKLNDYKVPYDDYITEAYGVHISTLLNKISAWTGGRFTFQIHDTFDMWDIKDFGRTTALAALNQVINTYKAEIRPDNFVIHIHKKTGSQTERYEYRTKKNIISDSFKDEGTGLVTKMHAQMKDGRTWVGMTADNLTAEERSLLQSIPGAIQNGKVMVNYLLSPYVNYWGSDSVPFFAGENIQQDIEDPVELLKSTREELRKKEMPELEINLSAADLHKIDRDEQPPDLGDAATVYDPEMEMHRIAVRIVELTEYPYSIDQHSKVTLANFALKDDVDLIADLERSRKVMENLLSGGRIRAEMFESFARQAVIDINNSKTELIYPPEGGILAQEKTNPLEQVRLTSKGLGISTDGWKTIRSAITARGVLAETVIGQLGAFVSMLIGSGNDVTQINTKGIAAGHADFNSAPFRVDMKGNLIANKLTANSAQIKSSNFSDGEILGSSINVGNGKFTVSKAGYAYAEGGLFSGGTITGALFRTAVSGARFEADSSGWHTYDSNNRERISISINNSYGMNAINFNKSNGSGSGTINGTDIGLTLESFGTLFLAALGGNVQVQGNTYFRDNVQFGNGVSGITISNVDGLQSELSSLRSLLNNVPRSFQTATNMTFDSTTRNLKLYSITGDLLALVNIPK
ncbi:phage tail protein [Paenibacillus sp. Marseille-P2973]|uniref:prophage endopeptidase tail family protein n=1 Tax=Paenibacillus sp. Marseille-P2973 TaxID=1871032 RepID=UPI001B384B2F|nr:prophage endopeptidase tail family protein [Paenibacillus sp. Marseille-P2973]MBQ4899368.1 phage tail protein [Paenibacillus sp. Marseille-P2973]